MRPRHYTAENHNATNAVEAGILASMRPRHYTAENWIVGSERRTKTEWLQ